MSFPRFLAWLVLAQAVGIVVAETSPAGVVYRVPDSRQGWVGSLKLILDTAQQGGGVNPTLGAATLAYRTWRPSVQGSWFTQ